MKSAILQSLVRTQLSDFLVDEAIDEAGLDPDSAAVSILRAEVDSKKDLSDLEMTFRGIASRVSESTREALDEEIGEIKEDLQWIGSTRGRYVITINEWIQPFHQEFNSIEQFEKVMIGGHSEREVVFATGSVESQEDLDALLAYLKSKDPPFKIHTKVSIQRETS